MDVLPWPEAGETIISVGHRVDGRSGIRAFYSHSIHKGAQGNIKGYSCMKVYFIGAGPGAADLITLRGQRRLLACPLVLYAGSLVPAELLAETSEAQTCINTAELHFDQVMAHMTDAHARGCDVARVHSGDPSIYGAIGEQIETLERLGIEYEIVPGVTATSASAAVLGSELTLPNISQTVIYTRYAGKTSMPDGESLESLAVHGATLAIHLGVPRIHKIVDILRPHYGGDCPVAVCYRTSWPDEDRVIGTLDDIVAKVRAKRFSRTTLILVGRVLQPEIIARSFLYREDKAHVYRPKGRPDHQPSTLHTQGVPPHA